MITVINLSNYRDHEFHYGGETAFYAKDLSIVRTVLYAVCSAYTKSSLHTALYLLYI